MAKHFAVVELQLHTNGAIANIVTDYGENEAAAISAQHSILATVPISGLVSGAAERVVFDDELQDSGGYITGEVLKGAGTFIQPEEETEPNEQEGEQE